MDQVQDYGYANKNPWIYCVKKLTPDIPRRKYRLKTGKTGIETRHVKSAKIKREKLNVVTTGDLKPPEKEEIDPEKIANTTSLNATGLGRRRRKK